MKVLILVACLVCATVAAARRPVSLRDEKVQKVVKFATQELVKYFREENLFKLYRLESAQYDEAKDTYDLEMIVGSTTCETDEIDPEDIDDCEFQEGQGTYKSCDVRLIPDGHFNEYRLSSVDCYLWLKP